MKKMKEKQSAGIDGISQDKLILGSKVLINQLLQILNQSIREGHFPSQWKEALVTLVLKKGDSTQKELLFLFFQDNFIMYCLVNLTAHGPHRECLFQSFHFVAEWPCGGHK